MKRGPKILSLGGALLLLGLLLSLILVAGSWPYMVATLAAARRER